MKNITIFSLVCLIFFIQTIEDSCQPLWPRIEFGNQFHQNENPEKLIIRFNTKSQCSKSFVILTDLKGTIRKQYCQSSIIKTSEKMANYQTFIQRCSLESIAYEEKFNYIVYGSNQTSGPSVPFDTTPIQTSIIHPNSTKTLRLIFMADWGELHTKVNEYQSLNQSLDKIRSQLDIHGLIINGDIGYDLDSNNGTNYEEILALISRICLYVPIFINTGNHQHNSQDDLKLLYLTFEQYGKDSKLATGLNLGNLYYIGFDPYQTVYKKTNLFNLRRLQDPSLQGLNSIIQQGKKTGKIMIPSSHYPLKCSDKSKNCQKDTQILKQYFDLMFQNDIKFYIGAHHHIYERIYPYCQNGSINYSKSPYYVGNQKCIISVIEGISGNDDKIVETYDTVQDYTAAVSFGRTGFGLLQVQPTRIKYQHYSSENLLTVTDEFQINYPHKGHQALLLQS